jgi:M6 family metalloprotease-like protein
MPRTVLLALTAAGALGAGVLAVPATAATTVTVADVAKALPTPAAAAALRVTGPAELAPGSPLHLTGSLSRRDPRTGRVGGALPARFRVRVSNEDHSVDRVFGPFTSATGAVDVDLPASATEGVNPTAWHGYREVLAVSVEDVRTLAGRQVSAAPVGAAGATIAVAPQGLQLVNDFTSSVGWVKPGDSYPLRLLVKNFTGRAQSGAVVTMSGVDGMRLVKARYGTTAVSVAGNRLTWRVPTVRAGSASVPTVATLVVEAKADTTAQDPTIVWKNLSTTARLTQGRTRRSSVSHGPKVIPPSQAYDTARYGDRPFPVVPIDYVDHTHRTENTGAKISRVINDPAYKGSTFGLYQEMSLGQLYPHATVPSAGIATRDVKASDGLKFSVPAPSGTCRGVSQVNPADGTPLPSYTTRIKDGWYQLPGTTDYYGDDKYGTGLAGAIAGVGAVFDIDGACGPTAKSAYDAAVAADPDIDFSDFDTDKDGVVDFFEVIFTGLGGNGVSQGLACDETTATNPDACGLGETPPNPSYDNIWPHSSSLEFSYTDPKTGQTGYVTHDQLKDLEGRPLYYTDATRTKMTTRKTAIKVFVRIGPYNVNPESALTKASVISHEYGHSLGLPDFYSTGSRDTYGDWNLMATDKSQSMDVFSRQELGWVVPQEITRGTTVKKGWKDSKIDTHEITWKTPAGKPYTLKGASVHNAEAYTAKLPTKRLISPSKFTNASPTHAWWSQSGNDFGCAPDGGHNLDVYLPMLKNVKPGAKITAEFKSMFSIEWDYDYGFVMTGKPDSRGVISSYTSHPSVNNYTTPASFNPNSNACQAKYGNGLTGTSASAAAGTQTVDRVAGTYDDPSFIPDSYDISDLAGTAGVLRFSYATDPGFAGPGWFIDDLVVKVDGKPVYSSGFEKDKGPESPNVFNGGCKEGTSVAAQCTHGWQYVDSSAGAPNDRGYYLEMRDRSGYDFNGKGQNDRSPIGFQPGLLLVYTDETHGYGNTGVDDPPAQTPIDAKPEPGSDTPDLNDAAFNAGETYSDIVKHVDNYTDPTTESGNFELRNNCLSFRVNRMSGDGVGPDSAIGRGGDLRGDVTFTLRTGCAPMDYGYTAAVKGQRGGTASHAASNSAPVARIESKPVTGRPGLVTLSGMSSYDDRQAPDQLRYTWDLNGDGRADATGPVVRARTIAGVTPVLTVTDADGASGSTGSVVRPAREAAPRDRAAFGSRNALPTRDAATRLAAVATDQRRRSLPGGLVALALGLAVAAGVGVRLSRQTTGR